MYGRVISLSKNLDSSKFCPPQTSSLKDSIGRMFSRESEEVSNVKKRLRRYKIALQAEILLVQKVIVMHTQHKDELVFMDFITDQTANVFPMIAAGKGLSEMILAADL